MIWYAGKLPDAALAYSVEWLSSFPFKNADFYMMLQACADESYTEGSGGVIAIGGWLSRPNDWKRFCPLWKSVLEKYKVTSFHFREFADKSHKNFTKTTYDHFNDKERDDFLYDLALVACEVGYPVGGCFPCASADADSIKSAYRMFFTGVAEVMKKNAA